MSSLFTQLMEGAAQAVSSDIALEAAQTVLGQVADDPRMQQAMNDLGLDKIVAGLKEALKVGIQTGIQTIGRDNGFLLNETVKIGLPPQVQQVLEVSLSVPGAEVVVKKISDEFEAAMNHAAEKAVPLGLDVFFAALQAMQFQDVKNIWKGEDQQAATRYFERVCTPQLKEKFGPIIKEQVEQNHVTRLYGELMDTALSLPVLSSVPFLQNILKVDIDEYTLEKGLQSLFVVIGQQETKIRTDPKFRTTDLLQQVFA